MSTETSTRKNRQEPTDVELAAELVKLEEQIEPVTARIAGIKAQLAERHPAKGDYEAGDYKVRITIAARKDLKKIEADFPVRQHPSLYKPALDTKKVDAFFELSREHDIADYQIAGSPSVKVL